ncbi:MAG: DUF2254 family protein, partial [Solirubrobacteraceae bacterium]|nr:DUF2254 family protein [Solirubrobacteraceae bacterium]
MTAAPRRAAGVFPILTFRARHLAGESLWLIPAFYVALALVLVGVTEVLPPIDVISAAQVDATLLTSIATGMLALAGFVITISFVTVEFASIAMSPRLVGILRRDRRLKRALGLSFGAFVYATFGALLVRPEEESVDDVFGIVATIWSIVAAGSFVLLLDRITNTLRAGNAVAMVGDKARKELEHVHPLDFAGDGSERSSSPAPAAVSGEAGGVAPRPVAATSSGVAMLTGPSPDAVEVRELPEPVDHAAAIEIREIVEPAMWDGDKGAPPTRRFLGDGPTTLHHEGSPGVLVAADLVRLAKFAADRDTTVRMLVPVGRFVPAGAAVLQVDGQPVEEHVATLRSSLAFASEPTLASDPRHAFRVLVDIGLKGLAPGVNDPTTAVQAIDQMHDLLRRLAWRQLGELRVLDAAGRVRVTMPAPTWGHY